MQTIERQYKNALPILDEIDRLYGELSVYQTRSLIPPVFDRRVSPIVDNFNRYSESVWTFDYTDKPTATTSLGGDRVVLCFSGGRDSIVSLMKYRDEGRDVVLYHMHGVNASQSDEIQAAEECAKYFNVPLICETLRYHGHNCWMEHPMKNIVIANGALNQCITKNVGSVVAFGNYTETFLRNINFEVCASDCMDMWEAYENVLSEDIPDFHVAINLENLGETMDRICGNDEVLDMSLSCLCRHSLRAYRHQWVKDKFGIVLPKRRCGSCAKCTAEYIYRADHGQTAFSESYYRYCMNQLYKVTIRGEAGFGAINNVTDVFETFLYYPVEQSRIYDQIINAKLQGANIKW